MTETTDPQADRYRNRTEMIEAVQWTGDNADQLRAFCGPDFDTIAPEDRTEDPDETAAVRTHLHGGWLGLKPGDWVLKYEDHFTATSDEAFRAVWEPDAPAPDVVAAIVAALQERAGELSELAEEQMRPSLEERAQEWHEAADVARRAAKAAFGAQQPKEA
jgi:hypothetical protein